MFRVVIPARHASTRLPGKPLLPIAGKPMIQWVHEAAVASGAKEVWIATDDQRIYQACTAFGATAIMTNAAHPSGTDRIAEVARLREWVNEDIIVNVQGDEPMLPPALIQRVAQQIERDSKAGLATLATPIESLAEFLDPNVVKVVLGQRERALYFSRAPIPWNRDGVTDQSRHDGALRHLGIYAYRVAALQRLANLKPTPLEMTEKLEQLRALENGIDIAVAVTTERPGPGVDTPEDLERVSRLMATRAASTVGRR